MPYPMTVEGHAMLEAELLTLKTETRPDVIAAIAEARAHGDLKENAEYHAAREQQSFIEGRIQDLEGKLSDAQIIDIMSLPKTGRVVFGATVQLVNSDTDETVTYKIVGDDEADISQGKISISAPISKSIIGKEEGDEAIVKTPDGEVYYDVLKVEYI